MVGYIISTYKYGLMINLKLSFVKFLVRIIASDWFIAQSGIHSSMKISVFSIGD